MSRQADEFVKWITHAVDTGVECLDVASGEVLVLLCAESGQKHMIQVEYLGNEPPVQGRINAGRNVISNDHDSVYYALIWSGQCKDPKNGGYIDAIAVESGSRFGETLFLTQPYKVAKDYSLVRSGGPLISSAEIESMWADHLSESEDDDEEREVSVEDTQRLNQLVSAVISTGFQRLQAGNETPFACLAHEGEDSFGVNEPELKEGEFEDLVNSVREAVASDEDAQQYAIGYMGNAEEEDGEIVQGLYVEAGDMNGQAPIYFIRYTVSESGVIQPADEVELYEEGESLWVGDDESDSEEDNESEEESSDSPLNDLIPSVFSMAVDRLKEGIDRPCACLANSADAPISILDPKPSDTSNEELLNVLRGHVTTLDEPQMYAIVYFAEMEVDGKDTDAIIVEAGERDGEASMFGMTYKVSKSGKVKHDEIEYLEAIDHLWR